MAALAFTLYMLVFHYLSNLPLDQPGGRSRQRGHRAKRERLEQFQALIPALTVLHVPCSLDSGRLSLGLRVIKKKSRWADLGSNTG